jgi:hypothetical protein
MLPEHRSYPINPPRRIIYQQAGLSVLAEFYLDHGIVRVQFKRGQYLSTVFLAEVLKNCRQALAA